jgi:hypothetical protein
MEVEVKEEIEGEVGVEEAGEVVGVVMLLEENGGPGGKMSGKSYPKWVLTYEE